MTKVSVMNEDKPTYIHPTAIVPDSVSIGESVEIGAYSVIGPEVKLSKNVKIHSHVVIDGDTFIDEGTEIFPYSTIGLVPQDLKFHGEKTKLHIGKNNRIREHSTFHLGTEDGGSLTKVGDNNLFMVGAHVAHDCMIGSHCVFANQATLAGHVTVEDFAIIGGLAAVHQFGRVGKNTMVGGLTAVTRDVPPFALITGAQYGGHLEGVNIVGLNRKGYSKADISTINSVFKTIFNKEDHAPIADKIERVIAEHSDNEHIAYLTNFLKQPSKLGLCRY